MNSFSIQSVMSIPFRASLVLLIFACSSESEVEKIDKDEPGFLNTPPIVESIDLGPAETYTNDMLGVVATFNDPDEDQLVTGTYEWHVIDARTGEDETVQTGYGNTLNGLTYFDRDDLVYLVVTPNDGVEDGEPATSDFLSILNSAPTSPIISITPDSATAGQEDLVCSVDEPAIDDDNDALFHSFTWRNADGIVQQATNNVVATSDIFPGESTTEGVWLCEVTADDGGLAGTASYASATIGAAPSCPDNWTKMPDGSRCVRAFAGPEYWSNAQATCMALDANLVRIADADENDFLRQLYNDTTGGDWYFAGLSDANDEGDWVWLDGFPTYYSNWDAGQPDHGSNENCLEVSAGMWGDTSCGTNSQTGYICQRYLYE